MRILNVILLWLFICQLCHASTSSELPKEDPPINFSLINDAYGSLLPLKAQIRFDDHNGSLCEALAKNELQKLWQKQKFRIIQSVQYTDEETPKEVKGELDFVVFSKKTGWALKVYEVKCGQSHGTLSHGASQLNRFYSALNSGRRLRIYSNFRNRNYFPSNKFKRLTREHFELFSLARKGFSVSELDILRVMLKGSHE